jgi:hypothetical protein
VRLKEYSIMKRKATLDLHRVKHADVEDKLIDFFFWQKFDFKEINIITGNSKKMQEIVMDFLDKYEFKYYISSHNLGEIVVVG